MASSTRRIFVVGAVYVDINVTTPIPVRTVPNGDTEAVGSDYEIGPGGSAFIFANVLRQLGGCPILVGQAGFDPLGKWLAKLTRRSKVPTDFVTRATVRTNFSANLTTTDGRSITLTAGTANQQLQAQDVLARWRKHRRHTSLLYIGGYSKMPTLARVYQTMARDARSAGIPVVLDHGRIHAGVTSRHRKKMLDLLRLISYYLPNQEEFRHITGARNLAAGFRWVARQTTATVVVKDGPRGAVAWLDGKLVRVPGFRVTVRHAVGAGDSFNAGLVAALQRGLELRQAIRYANAVAALKVSSADLPTAQQVLRLLRKA